MVLVYHKSKYSENKDKIIINKFCAVNAKDGKGLVTVTLNRPMLDTEAVVLAAELTEGTDLEDAAFTVVDATKDKAVVQYTFTTIANATAEDISVVVSAKVGAADAVKATAFVVDADAQAVVDAAIAALENSSVTITDDNVLNVPADTAKGVSFTFTTKGGANESKLAIAEDAKTATVTNDQQITGTDLTVTLTATKDGKTATQVYNVLVGEADTFTVSVEK